ncbi:MAG TPA: carboxypeptidase regulatory-like domain-containing protein [Thermoanaerobaculia bacterium]|nr:carboxypeptidase regulatory-like domain-containing protein [Thermoanaerobaculia bacterium]
MFGRLLVLVSCLTLAVPTLAAVTGVVMTADGQPLAGARLVAFALETTEARRARYLSDAPDRVPLAAAETAKNGRFSIDVPKEHPVVILHAEAPGFAPAAARVEREDEIGALALTKAASKSGRITAGGKPVGGARVIWASSIELIATTDAEGRYAVPDPDEWAARVTIIHPDYAIFEEVRRMTDLAIVRRLDPGVALTGRVVGRDGKTGIAGAEIAVDHWMLATSDENGRFTVAHAPKDWAWIAAKANNLSGRRARGGDLSIRLQPVAGVTGTLRDAKTSVPVAGAEISLSQASRAMTGGGTAESVITDAKGNFTIADAAPGNYTIWGNHPGYEVTRVDVTVGAAARATRNLLGTRLGRVLGTVIDEQKRPVAAARLSAAVNRSGPMPFVTYTPPQSAISAPDGTFVVGVTPEADVQVHARKKGVPPARSTSIRLAGGERKSGVIITMPSGITVTGRVTNRDDEPLAGVEIVTTEARSGGGPTQIIMRRGRLSDEEFVQTAKDGTFSLTLKEGKHDIAFRHEGFATKSLRAQEVSAAMRPLAVTLEPGVSIRGRVTRGGTGIGGVMVNLLSESARETAETAPDGSFTIGDLAPGSGMLMATKPDEFIQHNQPITIPADDLEIKVPPGGRVAGRVVDKETKAPVTSFDVGVSAARGGGGMIFVGTTRQRPITSDDGTFVLDDVPTGPQTLVVNAAGYTSATIPAINIEEGKSTPEVTVEMDRGSRIIGRVTSASGSPLANVAVRVNPPSGPMVRPPSFSMASAAITDTSGEYAIEAVEAGDRTLSFSLSGYVTTDKTAEVKGQETRIDAQLSSGVRVSGMVVTEGGAPVADATVMARSPAGGSSNYSNMRTDQNGAFTAEAMAPGRYTFSARKEGYAVAELADVDISSGAPVRLVLASGGTIYGRVIGLEPDQLAQTIVMAYGPNGGASAPVDGSGNFRLEGSPTGTVRLSAQVRNPFGMTGRRSAEKSVQVEQGSTVHAEIEFRSDTVIRGRVTRDGQPVANAMVNFFPRNAAAQTNGRTTTDGSGSYEVPGLDDAPYNVTVAEYPRGATFTTTYEVRGSGTFDIDMRSTAVRGRVLDSQTGQPIAGATINMRMPDAGFFGARTYLTDPTGVFIAEGLGAGSYNVSIEKEGYGTKVVELTVSDAPEELEVKLAPNAGVSIRIVDARDGRTLSASLRITDAQDRVLYDSPPRFGFGAMPEVTKIGLEPGTYKAIISASGYASRTVSIHAPGSHDIALSPGGTIVIRSKGSDIRRARLLEASGQEYTRGFRGRTFTIDPAPGVTQLEHIAPGSYTLQILGSRDEIIGSAQVVVGEAQAAVVEI